MCSSPGVSLLLVPLMERVKINVCNKPCIDTATSICPSLSLSIHPITNMSSYLTSIQTTRYSLVFPALIIICDFFLQQQDTLLQITYNLFSSISTLVLKTVSELLSCEKQFTTGVKCLYPILSVFSLSIQLKHFQPKLGTSFLLHPLQRGCMIHL